MPRTRSTMDRAALEEAALEKVQAEAKKYRIPVTNDKFDLIEKIMSYIERQDAQELAQETPGSRSRRQERQTRKQQFNRKSR